MMLRLTALLLVTCSTVLADTGPRGRLLKADQVAWGTNLVSDTLSTHQAGIATNAADIATLDAELAAHTVSNAASVIALDTRIDETQLAVALQTVNTNLAIIAQDFSNLDSYLLGGPSLVYSMTPEVVTQYVGTTPYVITNYTVTTDSSTTWSTTGSDTNAALIPALQYNQDVAATNFALANTNTYVTTNMFGLVGQALGLSGTNLSNFTGWMDAYQQMNLGYTALPTNLVFSIPSVLIPVETNIGTITNWASGGAVPSGWIDIEALNNNFDAISNDFANLETYLLAPATGAVTVLQANQDITQDNFALVNTNTYLTTNLFNIVADFMEMTVGERADYAEWLTAYQQMNTSYATIPTNLTFSFPSLYERVTVQDYSWTNGVLKPSGFNTLAPIYLRNGTQITNGYSANEIFQPVWTTTNMPSGWPTGTITNGMVKIPRAGNYIVKQASGYRTPDQSRFDFWAWFEVQNPGQTNWTSFGTLALVAPKVNTSVVHQNISILALDAGSLVRMQLKVSSSGLSATHMFRFPELTVVYLGNADDIINTGDEGPE